MKKRFFNRTEAGKFLAENLSGYLDRDDVLVLALPRGGVPVALEVATRLKVPLDVFVVRKLRLPDRPRKSLDRCTEMARQVQEDGNRYRDSRA